MSSRSGEWVRRKAIGAAIPLEAFAKAKRSTYSKHNALKEKHVKKLNKLKAYSKIKKRLEKQGLLQNPVLPADAMVRGISPAVPCAAWSLLARSSLSRPMRAWSCCDDRTMTLVLPLLHRRPASLNKQAGSSRSRCRHRRHCHRAGTWPLRVF